MRDVRLGQQQDLRGHARQQFAKEFHHGVCLRQMDARRAHPLADVRDGIQTHHPGSASHIVQQHLGQFQQYPRFVEIQVDLIVAKRGPKMPRPPGGGKLSQHRQTARPGYRGQVGRRLDFVKIPHIRLASLQVVLKPTAVLRDMVQDQVEHQIEALPQSLHVVPVSQRRIDLAIIDHRKPVVRRSREKGQQMQQAEQRSDPLLGKKVPQGAQRPLARRVDVVAIGDQHGIALVPPGAGRNRSRPRGFDQPCELRCPGFSRGPADLPQPMLQPLPIRHRESLPSVHRSSIPVMLVISTRRRRLSTV